MRDNYRVFCTAAVRTPLQVRSSNTIWLLAAFCLATMLLAGGAAADSATGNPMSSNRRLKVSFVTHSADRC